MTTTAKRYRKVWPDWTLREMRLVELHYRRMTRKQLVARHLPERTVKGVECMAHRLGVARRRKPVREWSRADLALLRELYGTMENAELCRRHFPGVSAVALGHRAMRLGLRSKEPEWTAAEDRVIRQYYGRMTNRDLAARHLPRRTPLAVEARGAKLGVSGRKGKERLWTARELRTLKMRYALHPLRTVAQYLPGRSLAAIRTRIALEGLQREGTPRAWGAREHALIRKHYEAKDGLQQLVRALPGRTQLAIQQQARKLGLSRAGNPWTAKDNALLRRLFRRYGFGTRIPGHTPASVRVHAQKLGLKRRPPPPPGSLQGKDWSEEELKTLREGQALSVKALLALLPGRSRSAISGKRFVMGIQRRVGTGAGSAWSPQEMSILRRHAHAAPRELLPLLPRRTYDSIRTRLRHVRMQ